MLEQLKLRTLGDGLNALYITGWPWGFWGSGVEHCGLKIKYPPQAHILNSWFPASGTIFGGCGKFKR
jgi:hypothetical protein